jgi:hypothetical protein
MMATFPGKRITPPGANVYRCVNADGAIVQQGAVIVQAGGESERPRRVL